MDAVMVAGEALLSGILKAVFEKLSSPVLEEFSLLWAFNKELDKLRSTATTIQAVLVDAEKRQLKDAAVKDWVRKIKDVAYDMEDIFDDLETEALRRKVEALEETMFHDRIVNKVHGFFSASNTLVFRLKMGHKIKKIQERLDAIAAERLKFHFREGVADGPTASILRRQTSTHSRVIESEIYGRDADKAKIVELLLPDMGNAEEDVSVVSIIGMGGLGKTTLAKLAYNDERVKQHFDLRMWVDVSLDFDVKRLTKKILEAAINNKCDLLSMDLLQSRLQEALNGKRFLLILDDVWNQEPNKWNNMKTLLRGSVGGCKILATTRNEKVAMIMGTRPMHHHLSALSKENCWLVFRQRAYEPGQEEVYPNLVLIGKDIVKKCGGLPLAAEALGGLMFCKKEEREWLSVRESEVWNLDKNDNEILPALRLSYDNLPSRLKQCFAYCSIFPKGSRFSKDELIRQWMAQGFLQSSSMRSKTMEEIGNNYFNDFMQRSLFQLVDRKYTNGDYICKMHDLIYDLAASIAGADRSVLDNSQAMTIHQTTRYSSMVCDHEVMLGNLQVLMKANKLRTFLLSPSLRYPWNGLKINSDFFLNFKQLRVLDLSETGIEKLPASIGNLKKLGYLDLSYTRIQSFPKNFCNLHSLQTLKLLRCVRLKELPQDMRKMISLRYVEIEPSSKLKIPSKGIGQLSWLQSFTVFTVGKEIGSHIDELKSQNHLQGDLKITMLQNVTNSKEAEEANLKEKRNLQSLTLSWEYLVGGDDANSTREEIDESVIEGLQPFSGLKTLVINNYMGARFPSWLVDLSLTNLFQLSLTKCIRCESLPQLGRLPFLSSLYLGGLDAIKFINMAGCKSSQGGFDAIMGFPSLQELTLVNMPELEGWSTSGAEEGPEKDQLLFPRLLKLAISSCPKLVSFPRLPPTLRLLRLKRCNKMLLRSLVVVPSSASLSYIYICDFRKMTSLPEGLFPNHCLLHLEIKHCPKLVSLPETVENLTSLKQLLIMYCPGMISLPASLQKLTQLRKMSIEGCPQLKRRCKKGSGEDWHKIAHIPEFIK